MTRTHVWLVVNKYTGRPFYALKPFYSREQARMACGNAGRAVEYVPERTR